MTLRSDTRRAFSLIVALGLAVGCTSTAEHRAAETADDPTGEPTPKTPEEERVETLENPPPEPPPWQEPRLDERPTFPWLDGEDPHASVAVGTTRDGWLMNGTALPSPGANYQVLPVQYARDLRYGTEEVIGALVRGANTVAEEFAGSVLYLGNIGAPHGGDIAWSVSHNNGRDADIAFYSTNPLGWQTRPPNLMHFGRNLRSAEAFGFYRFDTARNAAFVESLVQDAEIQLQYLFAAKHLRREMLAAMDTRGKLTAAERDIVNQVLYEPRGALPHDDHLHLRVYCSVEDVCGGCVNDGKLRDYVDPFVAERSACVEEYATLVGAGPTPKERAAAVRRLGMLGGEAHTETLLSALGDESSMVRVAAVEVLGDVGGKDAIESLLALVDKEQEMDVRCAAATAFGRIGWKATSAALAKLIAEDGDCTINDDPMPLAVVASMAASTTESHTVVAPLIDRLADERPRVRTAAAQALKKLVNRSEGVDWVTAGEPEISAARDAWNAWHQKHGKRNRDAWLVAGFNESGYEVKALTAASVPSLLDAIQGPPWVSYNAQRVLMRISDTEPPSLEWPVDDAAWHWTRHFKRYAKKYGIDLTDRPERP